MSAGGPLGGGSGVAPEPAGGSGARRASGSVAVAAVDLGATSGRVVLGRVGPDELRIEQLARFPNRPLRLPSGLHTDLGALWRGTAEGLAAALRIEPDLAGIGVDSWAVDYGLLRGDRVLGLPFHYRDERTARGVEAVHAVAPFAELYGRNGLQFLPFNTLYQFAAELGDGVLDAAETALLIPDLFSWMLSGELRAERTNASTTGLLDVRTQQWDRDLADRIGIPTRLLPELIDAGRRIGSLRPELLAEWGAVDAQRPDGGGAASGAAALRSDRRPVDVIAVGSHDTASAVLATPMEGPAAYISCGTWALVGVELEHPVVTEAAREANFTNEAGVDGTTRLLRNVMGLWLLSETVRGWEAEDGASISLPELLAAAAEASERAPIFDADDPRFLPPGDMPTRIAAWYEEHGLRGPRTRAGIARAIVESLAAAFAQAAHRAAELGGTRIEAIHLVGGGSLNELLCRLTADRAGLPVIAGPVEATAIGNVLVQARALGAVDADRWALRHLVARHETVRRYDPR
ncbi:rhamnulokinase [Leucobacter sp. CSA1]|uniref:Rhamnulokinase n=1 Tax=Leucobacter chromiisoli TaxID=2796471 RepID=A0A934UT83_9MICO|nr:rhamnulokinase family protein [Leucobacter chromiisoli]MBK0417455.1 rhamnulokinase [Leucobacter chromiisoli]